MKYVVAGMVMMALMLVLIVFLIMHESGELRQTVKESTKEAAQQGVDTAIAHAPESAEKAAENVLGRIMNPPRLPQAPTGSSEPSASPGSSPSPASSQTPEQSQTPAPSRAPTSAPPLPKLEVPRVDPVDMIGKVFETAHGAAKAADDLGQQMFEMDEEQEREIGREVHDMILKKHKCINSPQQLDKIKALAEPLVAIRERKGINYTFTIVDDKTVNAFSHLGGYIYVHKGLLDMVGPDEELQFVLGHEIGHVDKKHCVHGLTYAAQVSKWTHVAVGQIAQAAYHMIALGYNKDLEFEADEYSFRRMQQIGRSRDEALAFPRHFVKYAQEKGIEKGHRKPGSAPEAVVQEVDNHFRSHPPADDRLKRLEGLQL
jgi:peptidase M48-like protein